MKQKHLGKKKASLFKSMVLVYVLKKIKIKIKWAGGSMLCFCRQAFADCYHSHKLSGMQQFASAEGVVPWITEKGPKYSSEF